MKELMSDKEILKKLLEEGLSPEEREKLNNNRLVDKAIRRQWQPSSCESTDKRQEERMLNHIMNAITPRKSAFQLFRQYAWVASVVLLVICSALSVLLLTRSPEPEVWYVLSSGRQSMDSVRLADGTLVMLNAGGRLTYPQRFSGDKREVYLSGQAFFHVCSDAKHPFVVKSRKMDVTALGTAFEVFSFDDDKNVETVLLSGSVKVKPKNSKETKEFTLRPNERLSCQDGDAVLVDSVNADVYSAWRTGKCLYFKNEKLSMILPRLEKWYGQKIKCDVRMAEHYRFTFTLRNEPLELMLSIMSQSAPLKHKLVDDDYYMLEEIKKQKIVSTSKI